MNATASTMFVYKVSVVVLAVFVTYTHCGPGGNKKTQAQEQEVVTLRENLTSLWELVGQIQMQLEQLQQEEPRVYHHHHYHHRYNIGGTNESEDVINGTSTYEDFVQHEMSFERLLLPINAEYHQHHHHVHHHYPENMNDTENEPPKCNGNHNGFNSNGYPIDEDSDEILAKAVCHVRPNRALPLNERQNVRGTVYFRQKETQLSVYMNLRGFLTTPTDQKPNNANIHGLCIHEFGDLSNGCESAGDHYNPYNGDDQGFINSNKKHVGDFGNIRSDKEGQVETKLSDSSASLLGTYSIIGKTLVIHEITDISGLDYEDEKNPSSMNGKIGRRLACCVITKQGD